MRHRGATRILPISEAAASAAYSSRRGHPIHSLADHFVGRRPELAATGRGARRARRPPRPGDRDRRAAGIGKTRLLAELAARADARGHIVLSGPGAELERDLPFWVFVDALDEYVAGVEPAAAGEPRRGRPRRARPGLPVAVRARRRRRRRRSRTSATATHRAVRELLERLAATKPLVLVLDDFHWADPASVDLARRSLLHRPPAAPVLIALAVAAAPGVRRGCAARARAGARATASSTRIELEPADRRRGRRAARPRARRPPGGALLYEETGGNPFYLEQLARASDGGRAAARARRVGRRACRCRAMVVAALTEELALLSDGTPARAARARRSPATRSSPSSRRRRPASTERRRSKRSTSCWRCDLVRPTERAAAVPLPPPDRAPRRLRGHARRLAARRARAQRRRRWPRAAPARRRAPTTSSAPRAGRRRGRRRRRSPRPAREAAQRAPATAARWFAGALRLLAERAPGRRARRAAAAPAPRRWRRPAGSPRRTRRCSRASTLVPPRRSRCASRLDGGCARVEHLLGLPRAGPRAPDGRAGRPRPTPSGPRRRRADARARGRRAATACEYEAMQRVGRASAWPPPRPLGDRALTRAALATLARALGVGRRAGARRGRRWRRGSRAGRRAVRRGARAPPRCRRRPRRRGDLPRPLRRGRRPRRARARRRAGHRPGAAVPGHLRDPGRGLVHGRPPGRGRRAARRRRSKPRGCPATRRRWRGRCSAAPSSRSPRVTTRPRSPPARRAWTWPATRARTSSRRAPRRSSPSRCSTPASRRAAASARRLGRRATSPPSPTSGGPTSSS